MALKFPTMSEILLLSVATLLVFVTNGRAEVAYRVPSQMDRIYDVELDHHYRFRRDSDADNITTSSPDVVSRPPAIVPVPNTGVNLTTQAPPPTTQAPPPTTVKTNHVTTQHPDATTAFEMKDSHRYYRSHWVLGRDAHSLWVDESQLNWHESLSDSHRTASPIPLTFTALFYGHEVNKATIATGGFLYVSDFLHQWLTATQYVAPLMANFDTSLGNNSHVKYLDNGTAFIVSWQDVLLQDTPELGPFSFQAVLHQSGRIIFNYKKVPVSLTGISSDFHPVKVGLSDAYYIDRESDGNVQRRTIYEYHRVSLDKTHVKAGTAFILEPLPSCINHKSCSSCLEANTSFACGWCFNVGRCSDGIDRHRQEWLASSCHTAKLLTTSAAGCVNRDSGSSFPVAAVVVVLILVLIIGAVVGWVVYAYTHPQSPSGLWLIEHRPANISSHLSKVKFWKRDDSGEKYEVSMQPEADSVA